MLKETRQMTDLNNAVLKVLKEFRLKNGEPDMEGDDYESNIHRILRKHGYKQFPPVGIDKIDSWGREDSQGYHQVEHHDGEWNHSHYSDKDDENSFQISSKSGHSSEELDKHLTDYHK